MDRRNFLKLAASTTASLPLVMKSAALAQNPSSIAMMTWGGQWGENLAKFQDSPFKQKFGVSVVQERSATPVDRVTKLKINLQDQIYDLVQLSDTTVPLAEAQGVLDDLDENSPNLPLLRSVPARFKRKGWVGLNFSALGIAYNPKYVKTPPKSFADLWNPDYEGSIVLPEISHGLGPYIIPIGAMAAGKDMKDEETGFAMLRKMADLNPIWAKDTDTIMSSLLNGEAIIGLLYKSQTYTIQARGGDVEWVFPKEGAISYTSGTSIAKNTKNKTLAEQYVNLTLEPAVQKFVAEQFNYGVTNPATVSLLSAELKERVSFTDDEMSRLIDLDQQFMASKQGQWTDMWNRIVSGG